jgi:hypothetical protein
LIIGRQRVATELIQVDLYGINLHSSSITFVGVQDDKVHAVITGTATVNGVAGYAFTVTVADKREPGIGADQFRIQISGPTRYDSNAFAANAGLLTSGNIQVHATEQEHDKSKDDSDSDRGRSSNEPTPVPFLPGASPAIPAPTESPATPAIISAPPGVKTIQSTTILGAGPAQMLGGGSKPAGKTTGVASLLDEAASEHALFALLDETAFALQMDSAGTVALDAGQILDDGADGFTFEEIAPRLRLFAMPDSTPVSTVAFDESSGEFVDAEVLALQRWLEHGTTTDDESAEATPNVRVGKPAGGASAPMIDWTGGFQDIPSPAGMAPRT